MGRRPHLHRLAPLLAGVTSVLFEGKPIGTPDAGTFFRIIEDHKVNVHFTAPTAMRVVRKEDPDGELIKKYDLASLRASFLAGERLDPDTYEWTTQILAEATGRDIPSSTTGGRRRQAGRSLPIRSN